MISDPSDPRSPWCVWIENVNKHAGFVEYLRWLRLPVHSNELNTAKLLELFSQIGECDYKSTLDRLSHRTERLADKSFRVSASWRIRIGGIRGPESMLLPAFDAMGMPYIPSTSLKGVARSVAERTHVESNLVESIFGTIDDEAKVGAVIFLDAYPTSQKPLGGLRPDMANAIWKWSGSEALPEYNPNPNHFLSLYKPEFVVGLRKGSNCSDSHLEMAQQWLMVGLTQGIGSRVNSGYGELQLQHPSAITLSPKQKPSNTPFLKVPFELKGQLIHGSQKVRWRQNNQDEWQAKTSADAEVRPIAFRSMLRYWFRAFASGVIAERTVRATELEVFGGIDPEPNVGMFRLEIVGEESNARTYEQSGAIVLRNSAIGAIPQTEKQEKRQRAKRANYARLVRSLTWLMFHLGGIGQGARRHYYLRPGQNPPCRGVTLTVDPTNVQPSKLSETWRVPSKVTDFQTVFEQQLDEFYTALGRLIREPDFSWRDKVRTVVIPEPHLWAEVVDEHCVILAVRKPAKIPNNNRHPKTWVLQKLAEQFHRLEDKNTPDDKSLAKSLCGGVFKEETRRGYPFDRAVTPSPIWIRDLGGFQIVTVFGATQEPRQTYVDYIEQNSDVCIKLWPPSSC